MKITALIPDNIVKEVKYYTKGKNLTESLIIALKEWLAIKHIKELNESVEKAPLVFAEKFNADLIRNINRK